MFVRQTLAMTAVLTANTFEQTSMTYMYNYMHRLLNSHYYHSQNTKAFTRATV